MIFPRLILITEQAKKSLSLFLENIQGFYVHCGASLARAHSITHNPKHSQPSFTLIDDVQLWECKEVEIYFNDLNIEPFSALLRVVHNETNIRYR